MIFLYYKYILVICALQRISNQNQSLSPSVCQREYLFHLLITTVPSRIGTKLRVLKVITNEKTTISRSNGYCNGGSSCTHRSHEKHAEMILLKNNNKLSGNIIIEGNCASTAPCYHCLRMLLLHIQKNKSKFTLIYKLNGEFVKIKSTQLHTLLNGAVVSSGMRSHKRRC